jgi:hypothetical protein
MSYVVAIPTYDRYDVLENKTLKTLLDGNVSKNKIYLFVANKEQYRQYEEHIPKSMYKEIIIGKKGIANQRNFIANYFKEGQYVVSMDDDVEEFDILNQQSDKLVKITNIDELFIDSYKELKKEGLFIWGIYPVRNPFFMYEQTTTDLRFIIGVTFGFISRHNKSLKPSIKSETKEDYEQTILYFKMDGGVMRFNNITVKTKFNAPGGLGTDRFERNKNASEYLEKKYPDIISVFQRKNGTYEVKLKKLPRIGL